MFILTREENQYDQFGNYFVAAFSKKPTLNQLEYLFNEMGLAKHILSGGGRRGTEDTWYNLEEYEEGSLYT